MRATSHSVFPVTERPTTVSAWARAALDTSTRTTEATTTKPRRGAPTTLQVGRLASTVTHPEPRLVSGTAGYWSSALW